MGRNERRKATKFNEFSETRDDQSFREESAILPCSDNTFSIPNLSTRRSTLPSVYESDRTQANRALALSRVSCRINDRFESDRLVKSTETTDDRSGESLSFSLHAAPMASNGTAMVAVTNFERISKEFRKRAKRGNR